MTYSTVLFDCKNTPTHGISALTTHTLLALMFARVFWGGGERFPDLVLAIRAGSHPQQCGDGAHVRERASLWRWVGGWVAGRIGLKLAWLVLIVIILIR